MVQDEEHQLVPEPERVLEIQLAQMEPEIEDELNEVNPEEELHHAPGFENAAAQMMGVGPLIGDELDRMYPDREFHQVPEFEGAVNEPIQPVEIEPVQEIDERIELPQALVENIVAADEIPIRNEFDVLDQLAQDYQLAQNHQLAQDYQLAQDLQSAYDIESVAEPVSRRITREKRGAICKSARFNVVDLQCCVCAKKKRFQNLPSSAMNGYICSSECMQIENMKKK